MYYTIRCPECNVQTDIDSQKIPSFIRSEALDRDRTLRR